jgi:hypothetical protein
MQVSAASKAEDIPVSRSFSYSIELVIHQDFCNNLDSFRQHLVLVLLLQHFGLILLGLQLRLRFSFSLSAYHCSSSIRQNCVTAHVGPQPEAHQQPKATTLARADGERVGPEGASPQERSVLPRNTHWPQSSQHRSGTSAPAAQLSRNEKSGATGASSQWGSRRSRCSTRRCVASVHPFLFQFLTRTRSLGLASRLC